MCTKARYGLGCDFAFNLFTGFTRERKAHARNVHAAKAPGELRNGRAVAPFQHQFGVAQPTRNTALGRIARVDGKGPCSHFQLARLGQLARFCQCCVERNFQLRLHGRSVCAFAGAGQHHRQPVVGHLGGGAGRQYQHVLRRWCNGLRRSAARGEQGQHDRKQKPPSVQQALTHDKFPGLRQP